MATYTTSLRLTKSVLGGDIGGTWGTATNTDMDLLDTAIARISSVSVGGLTSITLTANNGASDQSRGALLNFTGTLTNNCTVTLPSTADRFGWAINQTVGDWNTSLKVGTGAVTADLACTHDTGSLCVSPYYSDGNNSVFYMGLCPRALYVPNNLAIGSFDNTGVPQTLIYMNNANSTVVSGAGSGVIVKDLGAGATFIAGSNASPIVNKVATWKVDQTGAATCFSSVDSALSMGIANGLTVYQLFYYNGASGTGSITTNGTVTAYNTTSDHRVKTVIGPYVAGDIDKVTVYNAKFNGDDAKGQAHKPRPMILAHELATAFPFAVTGTKDDTDAHGNPVYQQVDFGSLVPMLLGEIVALRARVAALEKPKP